LGSDGRRGMEGRGAARHGLAWHGEAGEARRGLARHGEEGQGLVGQAGLG